MQPFFIINTFFLKDPNDTLLIIILSYVQTIFHLKSTKFKYCIGRISHITANICVLFATLTRQSSNNESINLKHQFRSYA